MKFGGYAGRAAPSFRSLLLIGLLFTLVADFRRAEGDTNLLVVIMGLSNIVFGAALIATERYHHRRVLTMAVPFIIFAVASCTIGVLRGQDLYAVLAQAVPVIIFTQTFVIFATYPRTTDRLNQLISLSIISGLLAAVWKVVFAFSYYGLTEGTVRYQILSGASVLLFSYAVASFLTGGRKYMWPAMIMSLGVVFASVTRTYLVIFAVSGAIAIMLLPASHAKRSLMRAISLLLAIAGCLCVLKFVFPELGERWLQRIFSYREVGVDVTSLTRIAEAKGQLQELSNSPLGTTFGFGMLGKINWSGEEVNTLVSILGSNASTAGVSYGHNFYTGLIFVGGIVFGLPVALVIFGTLIRSYRKLRRQYAGLSGEERFAALFSVAATSGYVCFGFMGGTFGDRSISFYYAVATGLMLRFLVKGTGRTYSDARAQTGVQASGTFHDQTFPVAKP